MFSHFINFSFKISENSDSHFFHGFCGFGISENFDSEFLSHYVSGFYIRSSF